MNNGSSRLLPGPIDWVHTITVRHRAEPEQNVSIPTRSALQRNDGQSRLYSLWRTVPVCEATEQTRSFLDVGLVELDQAYLSDRERGTMRESQSAQEPGGAHVDRVLAEMHREFHSLLQQRAAILRRIGTIRQIISGLSNLFGDRVVDGELSGLVDQRSSNRQRGFTQTCRLVLMESKRPLMSQEVCQEIERRNPALLINHRDPVASVSTVLNRLSRYGEARVVVNERGRRAWVWTTERPAVPMHATAEPLNSESAPPDSLNSAERQ